MPDDKSLRATLAERIRAGERGAIARAITAIENELPTGIALADALQAHAGRAHVVGITGAPGAGKSTLINALLREYTKRGHRVAVVAVDPSSPLSGGAVLGDRIRMADTGAQDNVFIRSLASRGHLGGVSRTTQRVVDLLDAADFDPIIVETVGAGQSEVEIAQIADTSLVVCPPGLGDDVQAIKAGILEIADVLVVSKGDSPLAERTLRDLKDMLKLRNRSGARVPVMLTTATQDDGIGALVDAVAAHGEARGRGRRCAPSGEAAAEDPEIARARARVRALSEADAFRRHNGIELVDGGPGRAVLRMVVGAQHMNFNGTCHGGAIFALADSAFGVSSNSHGIVAAGIEAHCSYHAAARLGDVLTATASEVARNPRLATYRIDVTRADGTAIASFTGTVYVTSREHPPLE